MKTPVPLRQVLGNSLPPVRMLANFNLTLLSSKGSGSRIDMSVWKGQTLSANGQNIEGNTCGNRAKSRSEAFMSQPQYHATDFAEVKFSELI